MGERDDYKFLEIRDAIASINQKVNLIGVVIEYGLPKQTRGTDCHCTLKIADESYQHPGISVNVFAGSFDMLPRVASLGDIIQLSHVVMKSHGSEVFAVFNKKFSTFALYNGKEDEHPLPYQTYPKFRPRELDKKFVTGLRNWLVHLHLDGDSTNFLFVRDLKEGKSIDLFCKILHLCEDAKGEWMAFVWDGTDARPNVLSTRLEDERENPLPLHLESFPLPRNVLCNFPVVGTVLRVVFDQGFKRHLLHLLNAGQWVKLINVFCEVQAGLWRGVLTPVTKLRYTPSWDNLVLERQRLFDKRLSLQWGRNPFWSFPWTSRVTEVDCDDAPFATLMEALTYPEVTAKFRCVVRVLAAFPWKAKDFCCSRGIYRIRLTLEDPTARIHAYLYAEDGEKFFGGHPSVDVLTSKRNALLGITANDDKEINGAARNPPWVQCCLKSYYLTKSDIWGSRHFRIFGTKVVE
ncbi:hypothetical protein UlMin_008722 [Ulmus minor]